MGNSIVTTTKFVIFVSDILLLNLALLSASVIKFGGLLPNNESLDYAYLSLISMLNIFWLIISLDSIRGKEIVSLKQPLKNLVAPNVKNILVLIFFTFSFIVLSKSYVYSRIYIGSFFLIFSLSTLGLKIITYFILTKSSIVDSFRINVVVIGNGIVSKKLVKFFNSDYNIKFKLVKVLNFDNPEEDLEILRNYCATKKVSEIFYTRSLSDDPLLKKLTSLSFDEVVDIRIIPNISGLFNKRVNFEFLNDIVSLSITNEPLTNPSSRIFKRSFDVLFSILVLTLIYPWVFIIVAPLIKFSSSGPVYFKQLRTGKKNYNFNCLKFRTMRLNNESDEKQATKNDYRITWVGKLLRKTSIDELPQFINVLKGDLSVVGPRPHMLSHTREYSKLIDNYMIRHYVKPGITGLAQIKGFRGETKNIEFMKDRVKCDVEYINNWSFWLDLRIIFITTIQLFMTDDNAN